MSSIACRGMGEPRAWETVCDVLSGFGFRGVPSATGVPSAFARSVRPGWVIPVVVLTTLPTAGATLLLLLIRRSDTCSVTVEASHRGTTVHITGAPPRSALEALRQALTESTEPGLETPTAPAATEAPAARVSPDIGVVLPPLPHVPVQPALPVQAALPVQPAHSSRVDDATSAALQLSLVTEQGQRIIPTPLVLVGRNPQPLPDLPAAQLIRVNDPDFSLSKTHFAAGVDGARLWVRDLGSTNGTAVVDATGARRAVAAGETVPAGPGDRLLAGDRWFLVEAATVSLADVAEETVAGW